MVAVEMPTDVKERSDLAFSALAGRDAQNLPKYYRDYVDAGKTVLGKAKSIQMLRALHPSQAAVIDNSLDRLNRTESSVAWLPVDGRKADLVMLLDAQTAEPLLTLPLDPWQ